MVVNELNGSVRVSFLSGKGESMLNIKPTALDNDIYLCVNTVLSLLNETKTVVSRIMKKVYEE